MLRLVHFLLPLQHLEEIVSMRGLLVWCSLLLFLGMVACSKDDSVSSLNQVPFPQKVMISMSGTDVTNSTMHAGMAGTTLYKAYPSRIESGMTVWVQFRSPSMGMMTSGMGAMRMYDDGTHGDHMPGDGEYCYEDEDDMPGMHMMDAPHGHYEFDFYCENTHGDHGNHQSAYVEIR